MIAIEANVYKATTIVDGGWRISFDASEDMADLIPQITKLKGEPLYVVIMTEGEYRAQSNKGGKA